MELLDDWHAHLDKMPGKPETLRISGTCRFPTTSWKVELVERRGGINPEELFLDLKVTAPDGPVGDAVTDEFVEFVTRMEVIAYTSVVIWFEGSRVKALPVEIVQRQ